MNNENIALKTRGMLIMLSASVCFSIGGLLIKIIPWNPFAINGSRNLIAACVIGLYIYFTGHRIHCRERDRPSVYRAGLGHPADV